MPMDPAQIGAFRAKGISYLCCMCERMHHGHDQGLERCTGTQACKGPFAGGDFQDYQGPLTRDMIAGACFVCGEPAAYRLRPKLVGMTRVLGLCEKDRELMKQLRPTAPATAKRSTHVEDQ